MSLKQFLAQMLQTGAYSDITIKCGGSEFKCHRNIVCIQSNVFAAAFDGEFKESKEAMMKLEDDDEGAVRKMMEFFYKEDYTVGGSHTLDLLKEHFSVYIVADKYAIEPLKSLAHSRITSLLSLSENLPPSNDAIVDILSNHITHILPADPLRQAFLSWLFRPSARNPKLDLTPTSPLRPLLISDPDLCLSFLDLATSHLSACEKKIKTAASVLNEAYREQKQQTAFHVVNFCVFCQEFRYLVYGGTWPEEPRDLFFMCGVCKRETRYACE